MSRRYAGVALLLALSDCGGGASGGGAAPAIVATANLSSYRLQFSVGTANFAPPPPGSDQPAPSGPILNLVETFRQPNGVSALLSDNVSLTGPASFVIRSGTAGAGIVNDGGAPNQLVDTLLDLSAFGESLAANPYASAPGVDIGYSAEPGGPPAFPRTSDGNYPAGFNYAANVVTIGGFNASAFPKGFPLGTYLLNVSTPPGSSESHTWTASAKLATMTKLGLIPAPLVAFDGRGGGSVTVVVPSKVTELFVGITAIDQCWPFEAVTNTQTSAGVFSLFVRAPRAGSLTLAIPDNLGPPIANGNAPTFCSLAQNAAANPTGPANTGAPVTVQAVGVDYPLYEMSYPQSTAALPPIAGAVDPDGKADPQSDVTVSTQTAATAP